MLGEIGVSWVAEMSAGVPANCQHLKLKAPSFEERGID